MRSKVSGALLICVSAALWGFDGVVLTPRLYNLAVPFVVFLLHAVPFLLMQPVLYREYRPLVDLKAEGWLTLLLVSATGGLLGTFAIVKALFLVQFNQLSVVVLLQKLQPLIAILLAALVLKERLTLRFLSWAVVAVVGAYLLTFGLGVPNFSTGSATAQAAVWAVVAAACFGAATVLGKKLVGVLNFRAATFGRFGVTAALALAYLGVSASGVPLSGVTGANWVVILIIALTTGSGAIFLYYYGLTRVKATVATICELCLPLSAVAFDYLINRSVLGPWQWIGAALMIWAIARITTQNGSTD